MLIGEPGMGKSRLIAALEQAIGDPAPTAVLCSPLHKDAEFYPVLRALERIADLSGSDTSAEKAGPLGRSITPLADVDTTRTAGDLSGDLSATRTWVAHREPIVEDLLRQFAEIARRKPVLLVLEDLQWADTGTRDLLDRLVETVTELPVLLVVSSRPEACPAYPDHPQVSAKILAPLTPQHSALLSKEVARGTPLSEQTIDNIVERAGGVPLFLEELTRAAIGQGSLPQGGDDSPDNQVPSTLEAGIAARLDRLGAGKEIAQFGAIIGPEFSFAVLEALCGYSSARLEDALGELIQAGLLVVRGRPPDSTYAFKHALVREVARASLLRSRRRAVEDQLAAIAQQAANGDATKAE
jgi:predicted ATPase